MVPPPLVVVSGVSGVGKSAVGRRLAARLAVEYADGDDFHSSGNVEAMRAGRALTEAQREPWLTAVGEWLTHHASSGGVVSCSALRRRHRARLVASAPGVTFLHLTGPPELIRRRMVDRDHFMPASLLDSQLAAFEPFEADEPHVTLTVDQSPEEVVEQFLRLACEEEGLGTAGGGVGPQGP